MHAVTFTDDSTHPLHFCTGSSYSGRLDEEGKMTGIGTYRYPNGTKYHGHFKNGLFHGRGIIKHPSKFKICGYFINGKCDNYEVFFGDGLEYSETNWKYCSDSDRRFWAETVQGIPPVGESYLTKEKPPRFLPRGYYDTEEGFLDPKTNYVHDIVTGDRIRYVFRDEKKRLLINCRMNESDFHEQEERIANSKDHNISTDSWVSLTETE